MYFVNIIIIGMSSPFQFFFMSLLYLLFFFDVLETEFFPSL